MTCLFFMQGCLRSLTGEELEAARKKIADVISQITPLEIPPALSSKRKLLLRLSQKHLGGTAKLLNFLMDIHLLT